MNGVLEHVRALAEGREEPVCAFVYDLEALREHVSRTVASLPPGCRLFYAIKANSERPILEAMAPFVDGFEVASLGEILRVRAVAPEAPILFGGPGKTDDELRGAVEHGVNLLQVESAQELSRIERIARERDTVVPVLLRVNLRGPLPAATLAMAGRPTQFGTDEAEIPEVVRLAARCERVRLEGFHFHSISNNLDVKRHARMIEYYCERSRSWAEEFGLSPSYLNAGGGIGVNYEDLERQFDWETFVERLGPVLEEGLPHGEKVLFECGRYLAAACGYYAAEVLDLKRNHGKSYAVVRGGTHHFRLPVSWQHSHPFRVVPVERWDYPFARKELRGEEITVVGQLCTPKDVLARDVSVPRVRIGDVILFRYAGAYGWAISHHDFLSHPHPRQIYLG